ncbi:MAG TPA: DNA mismatch repair protein MutS [Clostridia bacterium]|nr:DNA mismatch repair protein MutS [Clostridia bacterium]
MDRNRILEFDVILNRLASFAMSESAKARCLALEPTLDEREAKRRLAETSEARRILEGMGAPPLTSMAELTKLIALIEAGDMLMPDQLERFASFAVSCRRMKQYLRRAESTGSEIALYGGSIADLSELQAEIERCIRNAQVDDRATNALRDIRRGMQGVAEQIKARLNAILARNKQWFSDSYVSMRGSHYTLPVRREHKNDVPGDMIEISNTGGTCFIEPAAVVKLQRELAALEVEEDAEIRRVLYTLTAQVGDELPGIRRNIEAMELLDFLFAKGALSVGMKGACPVLTAERRLAVHTARHPLLDEAIAVPLDLELGSGTRGVVVTGPNTGGKTVALKTVGLLSLMAQSGLHVPAAQGSVFPLFDLVLCDVGDGQSITENLSTFSSHMQNVIQVLREATAESLVLLDELGSGTDPAEGMGLAVAILEELCLRGCLFVATTHYPEVKAFAHAREGLENARMAFDRQNLKPLYRLEMGEAGESCALYIAKRLGLPEHILQNAGRAAYRADGAVQKEASFPAFAGGQARAHASRIVRDVPEKAASTRAARFNIGDSVVVYPSKEIGIVYAQANDKGEVGVQVKREKRLVPHTRLKLYIAAAELYPDNYDFSIVFDTVANRKARHLMGKRHVENNAVIVREGEEHPEPH